MLSNLGKEKIDTKACEKDPEKVQGTPGAYGGDEEGTSEFERNGDTKRNSLKSKVEEKIHQSKGEAIEDNSF